MLQTIEPDIVCLQEFDFASSTRGFAELYREALGPVFDIYTKQRTGRKLEGLALLLRRGCFEDVEVTDLELDPAFCDRVAIIARARHRATNQRIAVANTHLTVAHATNTHDIPMCRPEQMSQVLDAMADAMQPPSMPLEPDPGGDQGSLPEAAPEPCTCALICADMNCDHLETEPPAQRRGMPQYSAGEVGRPVQMAFDQGFLSALHEALGLGVRPISHTCSYAQDGCVDYVFFQHSAPDAMEVCDATLLPADVDPDTAWSEQTGWGPRGDWAMLSDHRPLLVDFRLAPFDGPECRAE